jgi:hypothetical protein
MARRVGAGPSGPRAPRSAAPRRSPPGESGPLLPRPCPSTPPTPPPRRAVCRPWGQWLPLCRQLAKAAQQEGLPGRRACGCSTTPPLRLPLPPARIDSPPGFAAPTFALDPPVILAAFNPHTAKMLAARRVAGVRVAQKGAARVARPATVSRSRTTKAMAYKVTLKTPSGEAPDGHPGWDRKGGLSPRRRWGSRAPMGHRGDGRWACPTFWRPA